MALLDLKGVTKVYRKGPLAVEALKNVDLEIKMGEFLAIAGPSGSGKTTLLNMIGCLDRLTSGTISMDGQSINELNDAQLSDLRREKIGFVFQSFNLIPVLTSYENVELALSLLGRTNKDVVYSILEEMGLKGLENRRPGELSGGQQQRVAIARALVKEPALVLADEPTANLDTENGQLVLELMRKLNEQKKVTFVFSTHDPLVMQACRRLIKVRDGEIVSDEGRG